MTHHSWALADTAKWLPTPDELSNKYSRGVLALRTGSSRYPGAAVLGAEAAFRTGIGALRFVPQLDDTAPKHGLPTPAAAVLSIRPETVVLSDLDTEVNRMMTPDAWVLGSGTDPRTRSASETRALERLLSEDTPLVLDAGAISLLSEPVRAPAIITPHQGEFLTLWRAVTDTEQPSNWPAERGTRVPFDALRGAAKHIAEMLNVTVLLKGSTNVVASPFGRAIVLGPATPWLATAGTGDVLAGMLGALVASHREALRADPDALSFLAATAASLHDLAARGAREHGAPIAALDVAHAIPQAVARARSSEPRT